MSRIDRNSGFSLIEIMVGMALGLIGMLIVAQVLTVSNGYRATTMASGEAQSIGNLSLYTVEREVRQAGFGIVSQNILDCNLTGYDNDRGVGISRTLMPVDISDTASADGVSDTLFVAYTSADARMSSVQLAAQYNGDNADLDVKNRFGFRVNDIILLSEPAKSCVMAQISALSATDVSKITHTGLRYNKSGGLATTYSANVGEVTDLGSDLTTHTYSVNGSHQLQQDDLLTGQSLILADNVLAFKAAYGHDTNADGTVDAWDRTPPADANAWRSVTNIRMGIAVRTPKRENTVVSPATLTLWSGGPTVNLSTEDQHYRYRVYSTNVPLRNLIWKAM